MTLGKRIKKYRQLRGYTQSQMAEKLSMSEANFSSYERDKSLPPSDVLSSIADILAVSADFLLGKTQNPSPLDPEMEFVSKLELSDNELLSRFSLVLDGRELTEEEAKKIIAYLRVDRQLNK